MGKLTKREKTMLYVLLYIIIISVAIFLLILPAKTKYGDLQTQNEAIQVELTAAKEAVKKYDDLEGELTKATEALNEQKEKFYYDVTNEDVDALLTSMVKAYALKPISLTIEEAKEEDLMNFQDYLAIQADEKSVEDVSVDKIKVYNVSMAVSGSISNVQNLVNDANNLKSLRVAGVSYVANTTDEAMTITFKLYII